MSRRLGAFFPDLDLVVHGGVNFAPYRARFAEWLAGCRAELREAYAAREGFMAAADRDPGERLRLSLDHGIFYEFMPVAEIAAAQPRRHWIGTIETPSIKRSRSAPTPGCGLCRRRHGPFRLA